MPAGLDYLVNGGFVSPKVAQALHLGGIVVVVGLLLLLITVGVDIHTTQTSLGCAAVCSQFDSTTGTVYKAPYSVATMNGTASPPASWENATTYCEGSECWLMPGA